MIHRRNFLLYSCYGLSLATLPALGWINGAMADQDSIGKINHTPAEWKKRLGDKAYHILREEGTEAPYSSALLKEKRAGMYVCKGCDLPLFNSQTKFDSGTGWPSFYRAIDGHIGTKKDMKLIMMRKEYHCSRCGGHHGHVFDDGPEPTGLRYCNNGAALRFIPDENA